MIIKETVVKSADNSGCVKMRCIGIEKKKKVATIGDVITIVVTEIDKKINVEKKEPIKTGKVYKALVVRTKNYCRRASGQRVSFKENGAILLSKTMLPMGTRFIGPFSAELKTKNFDQRLLSLINKFVLLKCYVNYFVFFYTK